MSTTPEEHGPPGDAETRQFIEDFAIMMTDAGMQRMASRVFTALLATQKGSLTAGELADVLQISPAAVSGAVRYLTHVGLVTRAREPGERRDHYLISDDQWYEGFGRKDSIYQQLSEVLGRGVDAVGHDTPAGKRIAETRAFFEFIGKEIPVLIDRWRQEKHE
ncbi:GbsR/MarR family transcriptional regulator [Amycolatopsis sp. YIM 10]|uniref:GbsR/MarR family transcriptional regulator n=1 Tax=Amycolatopsis sp. YIM 10 TaxID=2653857 RepID=UPI0012903832|nr:MarR family transcriptional regulator [Amycolatopsis sp. YIM 10]QFU85570.1 MarR family protein [Amycolatopsis sp. YIM 10]